MNKEIENIINKIDLTAPAPTSEPERQYYFIKKARKYVKELSNKLGRPLFMTTVTFGCQMNSDNRKMIKPLESL